MTRILITGKNGQVGHELVRALAPLGELIALDREGMDLTDAHAIQTVLETHRPDIIVNPAAYTAVDKAESEPDVAQAVNAAAPEAMAHWAAKHGALLIHYSTDYIFNGRGESAWREEDAADPQSVYGQSKWLGEQAVRATAPRHWILRTSWVFGAHGANFLKTMLRLASERSELKVVADQVGAPTSAALIANTTARLIQRYLSDGERSPFGTYHLVASGETSWHGYAQYLIGQASKLGFPLTLAPDAVLGIPTEAYPLPAKRPANSRLDCAKLKADFSITLPAWQDGVDTVLAALWQQREAE
ncbi:dTDP-4-dehydrorhamnose reductase [Chromobacterium sp. IIBBL 290-4]|uniref:dTDP-4-dehydrorhamnose reductase n=1 Tax=Chromobacterium sp. IIBBL 290-4 TaxID=2953890 RepID=UPI0020B8A3A1|nr:dTDP-4-dehydrorhamnose reductase [Chromobacterium sp. IIBBL 290-4]UTH76563.1 dTDP-4-dehydrorhamnose reductase [Chromobacterium sp. IIBBL 290-4]UTH76570.1 dTDP-4-dehydrorhamnose reductase [Chromobacterium sp. IIBBL 290-4]